MFICIDPGTTKSAIVCIEDDIVILSEKIQNKYIIRKIKELDITIKDSVLIEKIESRGKIIGKSTINTAIICGKFYQTFVLVHGVNPIFIERRDVLKTLKCKNDSEVRNRFFKEGVKVNKGIKIKADCWQALALYEYYKISIDLS